MESDRDLLERLKIGRLGYKALPYLRDVGFKFDEAQHPRDEQGRWTNIPTTQKELQAEATRLAQSEGLVPPRVKLLDSINADNRVGESGTHRGYTNFILLRKGRDPAATYETLLHEMAHYAYGPYEKPGEDQHSAGWQTFAIKYGAIPKAVSSTQERIAAGRTAAQKRQSK